MPVKPENRKRYPKDWKRFAQLMKSAAGFRCQASPTFPDCKAVHGFPHPVTGAIVVLTVAHLDHQPENNSGDNLRVWCQRCHNVYDREHRKANRLETYRQKRLAKKLIITSTGVFHPWIKEGDLVSHLRKHGLKLEDA